KWRKFWGILYRESSCSTARLELFEGSAPPAAEKLWKGEGSKRWIQKLCELAFPRSREEQAAGEDGQQSSLGTDGEFSMEENSLYSSRGKAGLEHAFEVTVRATESSERCRLWGRCILRAGEEALELGFPDLGDLEILYSWPYHFLRRFGRDKVTFSFEAGRRCTSGEGNFEFETRQGNEIFQAIESAINGNPPVPGKGWSTKAAVESEYAVPFDTIAKTFVAGKFSSSAHRPKE
ncbi:PREDICTED: LOW QUALITY PROTEIN: docking protein 2, partial [Tauraco erythrolophus]|uniref:LOW QUALITY PROTEIN: docking protein 2 n=1 Tax=Tauraco erythrolophus TaxID=121530 RepID=UPI0005235967